MLSMKMQEVTCHGVLFMCFDRYINFFPGFTVREI